MRSLCGACLREHLLITLVTAVPSRQQQGEQLLSVVSGIDWQGGHITPTCAQSRSQAVDSLMST